MPLWMMEDEDFHRGLQRRVTVNFDCTLSTSRIVMQLNNTIRVTTRNFLRRRREASKKFHDNLVVILTQVSLFVMAYAADTINTFRIDDIVDENRRTKRLKRNVASVFGFKSWEENMLLQH
ncbi:unnamed protein product [Lepeophtheirus salmonis]|uniref:(salmon louse) hypothetical protein n=1 Tax=Lepeophtheirus salmonis TaxID=72036 RepID=A0A7R8H2Z9_LEPSM|nr:unnamed protein product [Lepeophtheirus salmonis]CAF2832767.1 unnamed protein product [Lepeophtheirus salmonis]